jgi:hypothetical protein
MAKFRAFALYKSFKELITKYTLFHIMILGLSKAAAEE